MHIRLLLHIMIARLKRHFSLSPIKKAGLLLLFFILSKTAPCQKNSAVDKAVKAMYGVASFYNKHMEGEMTATGEIFHHSGMTAASNNFALNTWIRITNLRNGKSVIVRINDRMSKSMQALGRVADMTKTAAGQLDFLNRGLARVKVEEVMHL